MSHKCKAALIGALAAVACLLLAAAAGAQLPSSATISGTVTDASGAMVPQASVVVINEGTGVRLTTVSNNDGSFVVPALVVGSYTVTVTKQGFQTSTEKGIALHPGIVTPVSIVLKIGAVATELTVSASVAQVQTATHELSSQVAEQQVVTLPLNGRNYQGLSALMPGVTNLTPGTSLPTGGFLQGNVMSINGMSESGTFYTVDGIWDMNTGNMTETTITPNPDTIQEVRVLENNYGVQYSLMGANVVLLQTRNGTDTFHGSAFEYLRNDALDARNFFSPTVPSLKQNIFGYTLGGPFYIPHHYNTNRKKTFFFWSEQWVRQNIASTVVGPTPTADMRAGIFNDKIINPATGQPFPTNGSGQYVIPQTSLNTGALALLNAQAPLPNYGAPGAFVNYINLTPTINTQRDDEARVDHNFSDKFRLLAEYLDERQTNKNSYDNFVSATSTSEYGTPYNTQTDPITTKNQLAQLQLTATISSSMVNTIAVAMNNYVVYLALAGLSNLSQLPTLDQVLPFTGGFGSNRLPEIDFSESWASLGTPHILPINHASDLEDTLTDDWSWLRGKHYIQAGFNLVLGTKRQTDYSASNGDWFFNGEFTGDPIADYLLGDAATLTQVATETRPYVHYTIASPYVQDRWKVNRKLSVTAGLRVEYLPFPHAQPGYVSNFDPALYNPANAPIVNSNGTITTTPTYNPSNGLVLNGVNGVPLNFDNAHNWDWAPSVGFAYDVFGDGKTALRGGYGITYSRVPTAQDNSYYGGNNPPRIASLTLVTPSFPDAVGAGVAPAGVPTVQAMDANEYPGGMIQTYSLSLEHQLAGNWFASIAGAGNIGHHIGTRWDRNQALPDPPYDFNPLINTGTVSEYVYAPYLGYAAIGTAVSNANLYWDALEISVRHPVSRNLFLSVAYTWQHGLSDTRGLVSFGCQGCTTLVQDTYHPGSNYGTSNLNVPQVLSISYIWSLPWAQSARGAKGAALKGWKYSGITTLQSGFALDPGLSTAHPGLATRPDRAPVSIGGPKDRAEWFNTAAFTAPAAGYFGNAGTGSIPGPGLINFDMAFYKDFHIKERQTFEFRAELFNIFNHTNFANVATSLGAADFGQVTSARDPRIVEFALRYQF